MRIALAHNPRTTDDVTEATFMSRETTEALITGASRLGHDMVAIDVSVPVGELVAGLESLSPDLVFNAAEGWSGGARQPFFTALYAQIGLPHTGSGPYTQSIGLDKHATKLMVRKQGIRTPEWQFVRDAQDLDLRAVPCPAIVKPNFEGTSRGITQDSVTFSPSEALARAKELLAEFPEGVIVEQFIAGRELTVPFLEAVDNDLGGVLMPTEVVIEPREGSSRHNILDFSVKHANSRPVTATTPVLSFVTPAALPEDVYAQARKATRTAVRALGCRDIARVDYRLGDNDLLYLIEVNILPGLDPGVSLHRSAALAGLDAKDGALQAVLASACSRYGMNES